MEEFNRKPEISIILCTCDPRFDVLENVLNAIGRQTLASSRFELVVVDNNSAPALEEKWFLKWPELPLRLVREPKPGVPWGRALGIERARADLIVMLDDDNILDEDYLEKAIEIAASEPGVGAFGGISRPMLEIGRPRKWQTLMYPYLAIRDYGDQPITSNQDKWGQWEPIGAGMVVRADVAQRFAEMVRNVPMAAAMDRRGNSLLSGYDSLLARGAYRLGYSCSYQPRLKLSHFIKRSRMHPAYLVRLLYGHGRSIVILNTVLGNPSQKLGWPLLMARLFFRSIENGLGGAIIWAWDWGYFVECRGKAHASLRG